MLIDREHVLREARASYRRNRRRMRDLPAGGAAPPVVRLRSRREIRRWLAAIDRM